MIRHAGFAIVLAAGLACAWPASAQDNTQAPAAEQPAPAAGPTPTAPLTEIKIGYLGLNNDVRYHPEVAYTRIQISPAIKPVEGARMGLEDLAIVDEAVNLKLSLDEQMAND